MQADLLATAFVTERVRADVIAGPGLQQGTSDFVTIPAGSDAIVVRRAMLSATVTDQDSIEVGRDLPPDGLNIDDHTSFLRTMNRRGVTDYPTQVRYIRQMDKIQLLPYVALPSFEEADSNREYGAGARAEYLLDSQNSVGAVALGANSPAITRTAAGLFARLSLGHSNGLMTEALFTHRNVHANDQGIDQQNYYVRPYVAWPEWVESSLIYEYLHASRPAFQSAYQWGPEVNVRLHEHLSLIGDGRQLGMSGNTNWSWYGQLFLHFQI